MILVAFMAHSPASPFELAPPAIPAAPGTTLRSAAGGAVNDMLPCGVDPVNASPSRALDRRQLPI
jgi:hypothetical protein